LTGSAELTAAVSVGEAINRPKDIGAAKAQPISSCQHLNWQAVLPVDASRHIRRAEGPATMATSPVTS